MLLPWTSFFFLCAFVPALVLSQAATDSIRDADAAQSGYLDNHNLHPATVGSNIFGILWKNAYNPKELWYGRPLVYTPPGHSQVVFLASSMNVIRVIDAVNGTLLNSRVVQPPFLQSDIGCTDIPNYIGITGTPILDPSTNTVYFFSKGYRNGASSGGVANGIYQFYAVDVLTLQDRPGFPVLVDGHYADNDNSRYFLGGTILQRPSVTLVNGVVIGAFGGHCDLFNYTGMLVAVSTTPGVGVTSLYAMESSPGAPAVVSDITQQQGGKAGIWQSGMGISTDGSRIFIATGNGMGHANGNVPASGRTPLSTLDECIANFAVSTSGKITLTDYFEPYEYVTMDAGDRDLGSGGVTLLDPTVFAGTGVSRMAVSIGKNGKAYIMNANNLGGFKQGSGGTDDILQTIIAQAAVFGGAGSYPLEGGYIYFTPIGYPTVCYKLGFDQSGSPLFTLVGQTSTNGAGRVGIGVPTITTYKGQAGTGILWVTDPNVGLQAFSAVPVNGVLTSIPLPATGGLNKFLRPVFGDGRVYVSDSNGNVICLGSPVALPLQCSQPVAFGDLAIGSTATQIINCTALIPINSVNGCTTGDKTFHCSNSTLPKGPLARGATFSFPVTWNLTQASINNAQNASYGKVLPGVESTSLDLYTTNGVAQYSNVLPISLSGNTVSKTAFFTISPQEVDFGGIVLGSGGQSSGLSAAVILSNIGAQSMQFLGAAWTNSVDGSDGPIVYNNITNGKLGNGFSSSNLPNVGDTLTTNQAITVPLQFLASQTGSYSTFVQWWTTGGTAYVLLTGSASTAPIANISVSTVEGGWDYSEPLLLNFGTVMAGTTTLGDIRLCNQGGSALHITKSKPPVDTELLAPNAGVDLHEAQTIPVNACALGEIAIEAAPLGVNRLPHTVSDVWILNTDDLKFGVHDVQITANIVTKQVGPLLNNGSAEYLFLGCYFDGGGRQLSKDFNSATNENGQCQTTCFNAGYTFAGTEYNTECWCGNTAPSALKYAAESLKKCSFSCPGDTTQACGGPGTYISIYYDRTKYIPGPDSIPGAPAVSSSISSSKPSSSKVTLSSKPTNTAAASSKTSSTVSSSKPSSKTSSSVSSKPSSTAAGSAKPSSTSTTSKSSTSTSTSNSGIATPTGPIIVQSVGAYNYVGCYTEATTGRALSAKVYASDNMTVEICAAACQGYIWFGVEYRRECYCGNSLGAGSVLSTSGNTCSLTCLANPYEYCGGSSRLSMYNNLAPGSNRVGSSSSTSSSSKTSNSVTGAASSVAASGKNLMPSSKTTTATTTSGTTFSTLAAASTLSSVTSTSTGIPVKIGFAYLGCFSDPAGGPFNGHNMPMFFANNSMTPDQCISSALARRSAVPATTFLYAGVEYGRECYAYTAAPTPEPARLTGKHACSMNCVGDGTQSCGGPNQYNLWGATSATSTLVGTASAQWTAIPLTSTLN